MIDEPLQSSAELIDIAGGDQITMAVLIDQFVDTTNVGRHDRQPGTHRFDNRQGQAFILGGQQENCIGSKVLPNRSAFADEVYSVFCRLGPNHCLGHERRFVGSTANELQPHGGLDFGEGMQCHFMVLGTVYPGHHDDPRVCFDVSA